MSTVPGKEWAFWWFTVSFPRFSEEQKLESRSLIPSLLFFPLPVQSFSGSIYGGEKWGKERAMETHTQTRETEGKAGREPGGVLDDWSRVSQEGGWRKEVTEEES